MPFSQLLSPQTQTREEVHKILGLVSTYRGKHYVYATPSGFGKSNLLAAAVADLLKAGKKVQVFVTKDQEDLLLRILAPLTGHSYQNLKNDNFRNQEKVQNTIKELSKKYEKQLDMNHCSSSANNPFFKIEPFVSPEFDAVFIDDIQNLPDTRTEYAKKMNILVNDLNTLAQKKNIAILSFSSYPGAVKEVKKFDILTVIPPYLKNNKAELIYVDPPYKSDISALYKEGISALFKLLENNEVVVSGSLDAIKANPPYSSTEKVFYLKNTDVEEEKKLMKKEFLLSEIKSIKYQIEEELQKELPDYDRVKTLGTRLSKSAGEMSKF